MTIQIKQWTEQDFAAAKPAWNDLLARSDADPLFMSWEWQHTWWQTFAADLSLELVLVAAFDGGELAGIAPLYRSKSRVRGGFTVQRIQSIGNCWRGPATMRTEHVDMIACREQAGDVIARLIEYIERLQWDEWILADLRTDSITCKLIRDELGRNGYVREAESAESYYVDTDGTFSDYLAGLGVNTRLRFYNRRIYAETRGSITLGKARLEDLDRYFELLNRLHSLRWSREAFQGNRLAFNRRIAEWLAREDRLVFSLLAIDEEPVSILYDLRAGGQEYNIQGGFNETYDRKLALGYLHLGYAIEQAFNERKIHRFNLLVGPGKHTQFKARLAADHHDVVDLQVIRPKLLRAAYRAYDAWQPRRGAAA